jgi:type IV pilus assembly protein PilB
MAPRRLGEILVMAGLLDEQQLRFAIALQKKEGKRLGRVLVDRGIVESTAMLRALSQQLQIPPIDLDKLAIDPLVIQRVPKALARACDAVPFAAEGRSLDFALADPTNEEQLRRLRTELLVDVRRHLASVPAVQRALEKYYPQ